MNIKVVPKLGEILKERKMTQMQLSELTGINQAVISRFDRNKQHQDVHLVTIARALNLKVEDLFIIEEMMNNQVELLKEQDQLSYSTNNNRVGNVYHRVGSGKTGAQMDHIKDNYLAAEDKGSYEINIPSEQEEGREDLITHYNKNQTEQDKNNK